jgi:hypothetical protein
VRWFYLYGIFATVKANQPQIEDAFILGVGAGSGDGIPKTKGVYRVYPFFVPYMVL